MLDLTPADAASSVTASVDLTSRITATSPDALGVVSSTYGANPQTSPVQAAAEQKLDARFIRIPVGYRNGRVTSSAAGGPTTLDVPALVRQYRSWGYRVLVVIGGRTNDIDVQPGDTTRIIQALGFDGIDYSSSNEPGNQGSGMSSAIAAALRISDEGRALRADFKLWGPVWSYYNRGEIKQFAQALGTRLGGIDYHHYAMGTTSLSTATAMSQTGSFGQEIRDIKSDLASIGLGGVGVNVDELNFSWRYNDGTPGGNNRFFTAVDTVWMASALGHILQAGGKGMPYATQNGPLGVMVQAGQVNPDNRPASSPMPAYWGIAGWSGAGLFPHFKDSFYRTTSSDPSAEVFAANNEAAGYNVLAINKSESDTKSVTLATKAGTGGTYRAFRTDPARPYDAPVVVSTGSYSAAGSIAVTLPPMTVTTLVLTPGGGGPGPSAPGAPQGLSGVRSGASVALSWQPPASSGSSAVTGYRVARDGTDSTGGGAYVTIRPATARSFTFTLLTSAAYTFSVQAVSAAGTGPAATVSR